jgi:hypothetical protein
VYKEDTREKDSEKIKEWLNEKLEDEYPLRCLENLTLRWRL